MRLCVRLLPTHVHRSVCVNSYALVSVRICVCIYLPACVYASMYVHVSIRMYLLMYPPVCVYLYALLCMCSLSALLQSRRKHNRSLTRICLEDNLIDPLLIQAVSALTNVRRSVVGMCSAQRSKAKSSLLDARGGEFVCAVNTL